MAAAVAPRIAAVDSEAIVAAAWLHDVGYASNGTKDHVIAGTTFAPCDHFGQHNGKDCTWEHV